MKIAALITLTAAIALPAVAQTQIDSAAVQRCRIIPEAAARLACYDAIALPGIGSRAGWGAPVAGAAAASRAAPPATAGNAAAPPPAPTGTFGLEQRIAESAPDRLDSRLAAVIDGWEPNTRFTLENGQVWQVSDGSRAYYGSLDKPKVSITRGMLGSFYMSIEGVAQTPRVRRVQ